MSKTKWYQKPVYLLVALALVLSLGIAALPMAGTAEADGGNTLYVSKWAEYAENPVFAGTNRAYYPCVLAIDGTYHMWYTDEDGTGSYQVGYTTSADGVDWGSPTIVTGLAAKANHIVVVNVGTETSPDYRIWYWDNGVSIYSIDALRYAESTDGVRWNNDQVITQDITQDSNQKLITGTYPDWNTGSYGPGDVIYNPDGSSSLNDDDVWNNKYVMYYMGTDGNHEDIGLAYSVDGMYWKRYGDDPVLSPCTEEDDPNVGWDYRSVGYPTVMKDADGIWHMWFCGGPNTNHGIGYAWSNNGINWTKVSNPIFHKDDGVTWRANRTYTPMVIHDGSTYKMWFSGKDTTGNYAIGYATADGPYPTIQSAIDAAAGTTINVAAGTYEEAVVINKSLTLKGERRETTEIKFGYGYYPLPSPLTISADEVTVSGFTIRSGPYIEPSWTIALGGDSSLLTDLHVIKELCLWRNGNPKNSGAAVGFVSPNVVGFTFTDSTVESQWNGIYTREGSSGIEVRNVALTYPGEFGILLKSITGATIEGNTFTCTNAPRSFGIIVTRGSDDIVVEENGFIGYDKSSVRHVGILLQAYATGVMGDLDISGNEIGGFNIGVEVEDVATSGIHINCNSITGNTYGVMNRAPTTVDATNNWWGDTSGPDGSGPGFGDWVTANVDYDPWLGKITSFVIDHAKIDFKKEPDGDEKVRVKGSFEVNLPCDFGVPISESVTVNVGGLSWNITMEEKGKKGDKWEYKRPKHDDGDIKHMTIDWKKGKFDVRMDKANLKGLSGPNDVTIGIQIGDDLHEEIITMTVKKHHWDYKAK